MDLLEILRRCVGCLYISDLRVDPYYNAVAKYYFNSIHPDYIQQKEYSDVITYLYFKE